MTSGRTFCRFCIAACGVLVTTAADGTVVAVRGDPDHQVSSGYCCPKGRAIGAVENHPARITGPRLARNRAQVDAPPGEVVRDLATRLGQVRDSRGADAVALYQGTGAGFDAALWAAAGRFTRALGSRSRYTSLTVDAVAKPHVAELMAGVPSLVAHPDAQATLVVIVGMNPVLSHGHTVAMADPVSRLRQWVGQGELWVIDPRRTQTAQLATAHLACRPGTDHILVAHLVHEALSAADSADLARRTVGGAALAAALSAITAEATAEICGVDVGLVHRLVGSLLRHRRLAVLSGTGSTMAPGGNLTEWLLWCLGIVTDSFEQPGGMWFHPGFLSPLDPTRRPASVEHPGPATRPELRTRWGQRPSAALLDEIEGGAVRALIVVGGNPLTALPQSRRVRDALRGLDVLAVADVVDGPLTSLATHVLACPTQLERADISLPVELAQPAVVAQYTPAVRDRPPGVRSGWWWLAAVGAEMGVAVLPDGLDLGASDDDVLRALCAGSTFDAIRSVGTVVVGNAQPNAQPDAQPDAQPNAQPYAQPTEPWVGPALPGGRWDLAPASLLAEWNRTVTETAVPGGLRLVPQRQRGHVNSTFMTAADECRLRISPDDAERSGIPDGAPVVVTSGHGALQLIAQLDPTLTAGTVSIPHGFFAESVNDLTSGADVDPATGMPRYSAVPVEVAVAPTPWGRSDQPGPQTGWPGPAVPV